MTLTSSSGPNQITDRQNRTRITRRCEILDMAPTGSRGGSRQIPVLSVLIEGRPKPLIFLLNFVGRVGKYKKYLEIAESVDWIKIEESKTSKKSEISHDMNHDAKDHHYHDVLHGRRCGFSVIEDGSRIRIESFVDSKWWRFVDLERGVHGFEREGVDNPEDCARFIGGSGGQRAHVRGLPWQGKGSGRRGGIGGKLLGSREADMIVGSMAA
uniref:Uncharacterized protein n=1 Tax=Ananas comosus var. bracteatus TaxID=296719 RepID=A0A6V7P5Q1_ANACO|nr:unnamed protein product [Ananas comosus var. bracteatus]